MDKQEEIPKGLFSNSKVVARACERFFSNRKMPSYDLKGNQIDPITKQILTPKKCNRSSKG